MKKLFTSLFLVGVTTVSFNTQASPNYDLNVVCDAMRDTASNIMVGRQNGLPYSKAISIVNQLVEQPLTPVFLLMVDSAYQVPIEDSEMQKEMSAQVFGIQQYKACWDILPYN